MKKKATNGNTPATQHDLAMLGGHLSSRIDDVEEDVKSLREEMREEFASQRKIMEAILSIIQTLEVRAKETKGHDVMLKNHEKRISDTEIQIRMIRR